MKSSWSFLISWSFAILSASEMSTLSLILKELIFFRNKIKRRKNNILIWDQREINIYFLYSEKLKSKLVKFESRAISLLTTKTLSSVIIQQLGKNLTLIRPSKKLTFWNLVEGMLEGSKRLSLRVVWVHSL